MVRHRIDRARGGVVAARGTLTIACVTKRPDKPMRATAIPVDIADRFEVAPVPPSEDRPADDRELGEALGPPCGPDHVDRPVDAHAEPHREHDEVIEVDVDSEGEHRQEEQPGGHDDRGQDQHRGPERTGHQRGGDEQAQEGQPQDDGRVALQLPSHLAEERAVGGERPG
mgnify:CR=1 FL=1